MRAGPSSNDGIGNYPSRQSGIARNFSLFVEGRIPQPRPLQMKRMSARDRLDEPPPTLEFRVIGGTIYLPDQLMTVVSSQARRIARMLHLSRDDTDDLEQTLWADLTKAFKKYDPGRGTPPFAFALACLTLACKHRGRELIRRRFNQPAAEFTSDPAELDLAHPSRSPHPGTCADLSLDVQELVSNLPHHLGRLAEDLKTRTPAEIARDSGVHRGTVLRRAQALRALFEPFMEESAPARNTRPANAEMYQREELSPDGGPPA